MAARDPNAYDETVVRECMARWKGWSDDESLGSLFEVHVYRHIKAQAARIAELEAEVDEWRGAFEPVLTPKGERLRLKVTRDEAAYSIAPGTVPPMVGNAYEEVED